MLHLSSFLIAIDTLDEEPHVARYYRRLASFAAGHPLRSAGIGRSDPLDSVHPTRCRAPSPLRLRADAAGSVRTAVVVWSGGGPIGIELAARHPERVSRSSSATPSGLAAAADYPDGIAPEIIDCSSGTIPIPMRNGISAAPTTWPFRSEHGEQRPVPRVDAAASRRSASPASAGSYLTMTSGADVRDLLPQIQVPTLVLHRTGYRFTPPALGRYLAEHIPGATWRGAGPRPDHVVCRPGPAVDEIEEFLTGHRHGSADRVSRPCCSPTSSTRRNARRDGRPAWRGELDAHDAIVRAELDRFGGREVNTTGDGFVAKFDVPTAAVRGTLAIVRSAQAAGFSLRAGVHTGECERRGDDLAGLAVHIAAVSAAMPARRRSWSPARSATSSRAPAWSWNHVASTS